MPLAFEFLLLRLSHRRPLMLSACRSTRHSSRRLGNSNDTYRPSSFCGSQCHVMLRLYARSRMFRTPNRPSLHLIPVDTRIQLFIHQAHQADMVASYQVQAMFRRLRGFRVVLGANDALNCTGEDEVGGLVEGLEGAY